MYKFNPKNKQTILAITYYGNTTELLVIYERNSKFHYVLYKINDVFHILCIVTLIM